MTKNHTFLVIYYHFLVLENQLKYLYFYNITRKIDIFVQCRSIISRNFKARSSRNLDLEFLINHYNFQVVHDWPLVKEPWSCFLPPSFMIDYSTNLLSLSNFLILDSLEGYVTESITWPHYIAEILLPCQQRDVGWGLLPSFFAYIWGLCNYNCCQKPGENSPHS